MTDAPALRPAVAAVLDALRASADHRGRVVLDKHDLARLTGYSASICCNARAELVAVGVVRKIGFSRPSVLVVLR